MMSAPCFAALLLWAGEGLTNEVPPPQAIVGGSVAQTCQWPATVMVNSCSATLVHPQVVLYAAHCPNTNTVRFGETGNGGSVGTSYCRGAPEYPATGYDYKYCKLSQSVTGVPIAPILMGCEREQLKEGTPVYVVGFGQTNGAGGGYGTKRWVEGYIGGFPDGGKMIGILYEDPDTGACFGDSGGSAYVELEDGSWRVFGITSTISGACGERSQHVPMWNAVGWVEQDSGVDITPCHDADGAWNPSPQCTGAPLSPNSGSGLSWSNDCAGAPLGPAIETCGPPSGDPQDTTAPTIEIVTPSSGAVPGPEFSTPIEISASDDWGILDVIVTIDGEDTVLKAEPWELPSVLFPEGTWEIGASARDWSGNVTDAAPVVLQVGEGGDGGDDGSTDDPGGTDGHDGTGSSTDDGGTGPGSSSGGGSDLGGGDESEEGCGCRSTHGSQAFAALFLLALACRRKRG